MFHPMVAGVTIPGMGLFLLIIAPYVDSNPSNKPDDRKFAICVVHDLPDVLGGARHHRLVLPWPGLQLRVPLERRHLLRALGADVVSIVARSSASRSSSSWRRSRCSPPPAGGRSDARGSHHRHAQRRDQGERLERARGHRATPSEDARARAEETRKALGSGGVPGHARQHRARGAGPGRRRGDPGQPAAVLQPGDPHHDGAQHRRVRCRGDRVPVREVGRRLRRQGRRRRSASPTSRRTGTPTRRRTTCPRRAPTCSRTRRPTCRRRRRCPSTSRSSPAWSRGSSRCTRSACTSAAGCRGARPRSGSSARATARSTAGSARRRAARRRAGSTTSWSRIAGQQDRRSTPALVVTGPPIGTDTTGQGAEGPPCVVSRPARPPSPARSSEEATVTLRTLLILINVAAVARDHRDHRRQGAVGPARAQRRSRRRT